jgi:DNA ligase (NAD+)
VAPADVRRRVERLRREIRRHDRLYYAAARPEIADAEYDALVGELRELEARHPELVTADSPTQRPSGRPARLFAPVEHRVAMLSLDNATDVAALREFTARVERAVSPARLRWVCEPKVAGSVAAFFADPGNCRVLERLAAAGVATTERQAPARREPLAGKTFVLTGTLEGLTRDAAAELARQLGVKELDERALMAMVQSA